jgi:hypothetical protein
MLETYKKLYKQTGKEQPLLKNARYAQHKSLATIALLTRP